ncbi:MAG TPA: alkaline phosphatase family protein [Solirubrobacteraceae bacterium]|nr:alkaline phosphatase family protein [Solirubrobacteraceae bacterium]
MRGDRHRRSHGRAGVALKKLVLAVIDGARPAMIEAAVAAEQAPALATLIERGSYIPDAVSAFPSVTPVCAATIATGLGPDRHLIPSMNWYHREEARYVEYGSSFRAALRFGLGRQLTDTIYNMNGAHLAPEALTIFERLDDAGLRTAGTTYLIYRGRHLHQPAQDSALTRIAAFALVRRPVMGPRELFYADIFSSRDSGCRSTLGMPGARDRHAGCVGEYLVRNDLFDFLLLSLPDNDNHSHRLGPDAQVAAIAQADRQLVRLFAAAGGADAFLEDHAVIVVADHAHTLVERSISLGAQFADFDVRRPTDMRALEPSQIAICPAQRSAMIYVFSPATLERVLARAQRIEGVEQVIWREGEEACVARGGEQLRFAPGDQLEDLRGRRWRLSGSLAALELRVTHGVVRSEEFPDALGRVWDACACATAGEVLLSAADGAEFSDWGGADHVGGGSHGSLSAGDSHAPLIHCGVEGAGHRAQWSIADVTPLIARHFES